MIPQGTSRSSAIVSATRGRGAAVLVGLGVGLGVGVLVLPGVGGSALVDGVGVGAPLSLGAMDGAGSVGSAHPASTATAAPAEPASSARRESMTRLFTSPGIGPQIRLGCARGRPDGAAGMRERFASMERLEADDIADAIGYMVTRPRRVAVNEILIRPTEQDQ